VFLGDIATGSVKHDGLSDVYISDPPKELLREQRCLTRGKAASSERHNSAASPQAWADTKVTGCLRGVILGGHAQGGHTALSGLNEQLLV
jgi:hypothetical protein